MQVSVVVYGAATIGQELTQTVATSGCEVILIDKSEVLLKSGVEKIESELDARIARWGLTSGEKRAIMSRIKTSTDINDVANANFVIETVKETLDEKKSLFKEIEEKCDEKAIIVTNSATISVTEIAAECKNPSRTISMHFQSPIPKVVLVEISRGLKTSQATYDAALRFASMLQKTAITVYDSPGFITTRIALPMINQAVKVLEEGIATCSQIDNAMKLGLGLNTGPLSLADRIGIDTVVFYMETLYQETFDQTFLPAKLLKKMVRADYKGQKNRRGFYAYDESGKRLSTEALKISDLSAVKQ